ncbi:tetratricopeptide repeat protein [Planctomicrobium sp. SH527]|uniref:tetratricopeptide repeat protein n=1 Tax=Planctomicrobium sp. SH527 TaxID=3448123 RepID=UPI003F5BB9A1
MKTVRNCHPGVPRPVTRFNTAILSVCLALSMSPIAWGDAGQVEAHAEAIPLLDRDAFSSAASELLSSEGPGVGDDLQEQKAQRFRELKAKLDELSGLIQAPPTQSNQQPQSQPRSQPPVTAPSPSNPAGSPTTINAAKIPTDNMLPKPSETGVPPQLLPGVMGGNTASTNDPAIRGIVKPTDPEAGMVSNGNRPELNPLPKQADPDGKPVAGPAEPFSGQVDRFALANSLFGTGDVESCLKVLEQTDFSHLTREEQVWSMYMQGCCHRRAGRIDEARKLYRGVIAQPEADWVKEQAHWWLSNLDSKSKLQGDIQRLNTTIKAWETEIATLGTK